MNEKKKVTNEELLEHLKTIEMANGCIVNAINTLFVCLVENKEQLKLNPSTVRVLLHGSMAMCSVTEVVNKSAGVGNKAKDKDETLPDDINELLKILFH